ncbi:MAG TPA: glycosyltransferase family 4 protein [Terracidiphilus sp.]|nr:glycosyltransferase family 4 protein [Terracidiphilus sp.]
MSLRVGKRFGDLVIRQGFGNATHAYVFSGAGLEIIQAAKSRGLQTVVELPAAPCEIEQNIMDQEFSNYGDWETNANCDEVLKEFAALQRIEWATADRIVVPSQFVARGLETLGVPPDRFVIVPYGIGGTLKQTVRNERTGPLRVLTVAGVKLQKGPQYILQAAKLLRSGFEFRLVGSSALSSSAEKQLRENVDLVGIVPRTEVRAHFEWADVFLFPSICDGFGVVLLEALAAGLPIITTPNTGVAIRDGIEGFVVPIRDGSAIADRLDRLASDPSLLKQMSQHAMERAKDFTLDAYSDRLYDALTGEPTESEKDNAALSFKC